MTAVQQGRLPHVHGTAWEMHVLTMAPRLSLPFCFSLSLCLCLSVCLSLSLSLSLPLSFSLSLSLSLPPLSSPNHHMVVWCCGQGVTECHECQPKPPLKSFPGSSLSLSLSLSSSLPPSPPLPSPPLPSPNHHMVVWCCGQGVTECHECQPKPPLKSFPGSSLSLSLSLSLFLPPLPSPLLITTW